ncbi:MAG: hypothetical protein R3264_04965 [Anaerolineae bacterium]|nr:hypothetical protein [Anaerolineae bacterium]
MAYLPKVGDVVGIYNWFGVILATHFDEEGNLSILEVQTPRNLFRNLNPELIDYRQNPEAIRRASRADLEQEIEMRQKMLDSNIEALVKAATTIDPVEAEIIA